MSRYQSVVTRLKEINDAVFQELCDSYLASENRNYKAISRVGSHETTQKTTKGTPDCLFMLPNGNYLFVEVTTQQKDVMNKLRKDLRSCHEEDKTNIPKQKIEEVLLCLNSNPDTAELESLTKFCLELQLPVPEFYTLDRLALQLHLHYPNLVNEYLDLPFDKGQIVSLDHFVKKYQERSGSIATPLNNPFLFREKELDSTIQMLNDSDIVILTGAAGVGKTRLAVESISRFQKQNLDFNAYAVLDKGADLVQDLILYFETNSRASLHNVLFVDDVNRLGSLRPLLNFHSKIGPGKLKLVLTVRLYAFEAVKNMIIDSGYTHIKLNSFTLDQIGKIISTPPFEIKLPVQKNTILRISKGNPRLAIMMALLAKMQLRIDSSSTVAGIFENYHQTFLKEDALLEDQDVRKTLGLLSFFRIIQLEENGIFDELCSLFSIDKSSSLDAIIQLEKKKLVDLNYGIVKISEQTLSTFFFFKVFFDWKLLSFDKLLINYFSDCSNRFIDSINSVNQVFNSEELESEFRSAFTEYYNSLKPESANLTAKLLDQFWVYLIDEVFEYVRKALDSLPISKPEDYRTDYDPNDYSPPKDQILKLLGNLYQSAEDLNDALQISFEYVRKKPQALPELIHNIDGRLAFDSTDAPEFKRQKILIDFFAKKISIKDELFIKSFTAVSGNILNHNFQQTEQINSINLSIYRYDPPLNESFKEIRTRTWLLLESLLNNYQDDVLNVFIEYVNVNPNYRNEISKFDMDFLVPIIERHLSPKSFLACFFVNRLYSTIERQGMDLKEIETLKNQFRNQHYEWYEVLNWNIFKNKDGIVYRDQPEFQELKEDQIRETFQFVSFEEFLAFEAFFEQLNTWSRNRIYLSLDSIDITLHQNLLTDQKLGMEILESILTMQVYQQVNLFRTAKHIAQSLDLIDQVWQITGQSRTELGIRSRLTILQLIPDKLLCNKHLQWLYKEFDAISGDRFISIKGYTGFIALDERFMDKVLQVIVNKNEDNQTDNLRLDYDFFEKAGKLISNTDLLRIAYVQQIQFERHYGFNEAGLTYMMERDPDFLNYFLQMIVDDLEAIRFRDYTYLSCIWKMSNSEILIDQAIEIILSKKREFGLGQSFLNAFFQKIPKSAISKADKYIMNSITKHACDPKRIDLIFDVIFHSRAELFEEALTTYLKENLDLDHFKQIEFVNKDTSFVGDVNIGEIEADRWSRILQITNRAQLGYKSRPIRKYINERIERSRKLALTESQRKFVRGY